MIIDTHCHLDFEEFHSDRDGVIKRAREAGVPYLVNIGSSLEGSKRSAELASAYDNIFASVGIHPHHAGETGEKEFAEIKLLADREKIVAIGEVGLDYFKSPSGQEKQKPLLEKFTALAKEKNLPLVIHSRDAASDVFSVLSENLTAPIRGVMHCFSGSREELKEALDLGLFVSFTCNLTFKNARTLRGVAKKVPIDRLLLETDAPFLAPQSKRGQRNEPAYITELRDVISELLDLSPDEVERITTANAVKLFDLKI